MQAVLATSRAYVWAIYAVDYDLDIKPVLAVTAPDCTCRADSMGVLQEMQKNHSRGYGALPAHVAAFVRGNQGTHAHTQVSYDTGGAREINTAGKVLDTLKPQHVVLDLYLRYAGGHWQIFEVINLS